MNTPFEWNEETVKRLVYLRREGITGSAIARDMGISKNAVLGKIYRLGMSHPENNPISPVPSKEKMKFMNLWNSRKSPKEISKLMGMRGAAAVNDRARSWGLLTRKINNVAISIRRRKSKMNGREVDEHRVEHDSHSGPGCKWLHGEPIDLDWCGAPAHRDSSWCEYHHGIVFVPQRKKDGGEIT